MNAYTTCPMAIAKARTDTYNVQRWLHGELAESFFSSSEGLVLIGVVPNGFIAGAFCAVPGNEIPEWRSREIIAESVVKGDS